jgi:hypothetical protein
MEQFQKRSLRTPIVLPMLWLSIASFAAAQSGALYSKAPTEHFNPQDLMPLSPDGQPMDLRDSIYIDRVPPALTIQDSRQNFDKRTAAAIRTTAGTPLDNLGDEDYGTAILAYFAYQDYFNDPATASSYRSQAADSLKKRQAGQVGTGGDYDFLLQFYLTLVYRYYDDLAAIPCDTNSPCGNGNSTLAQHVVNDLLSVRGPVGKHDSEYVHDCALACVNVPETENHLLMIETARYLTNQLVYQQTHDHNFDNRRNGDRNDPQATPVWLLNTLRATLTNDFVEYNARPYQDMIMLALLNLQSYSYDGDVKLAARMALDYISAKVAVSSNDLRRAPPFRRRNEDQHYGPVSAEGRLASPLLLPNGAYEPDPQGTWFSVLAGNTGLLGPSVPKIPAAGGFSMGMLFAGLHDYRVPDPILDLFINSSDRHFYQRFEHKHTIRDAGNTETVDEVYSGSPSYLITGGGYPTNYAYIPEAAGLNAPYGASADLGSAMPTTFMPTGSGVHFCSQPQCGDNGLSLSEMIQFDRYATGLDGGHYRMCAATDFACGVSVYLPEAIRNPAPNDPTVIQAGPWTFVDRGHVGEAKPGFYLAIYKSDSPQLAFLEAYDTWLHPGLNFDEFRGRVLAANGGTVFKTDAINKYMTQSGQLIGFVVEPDRDSGAVVSLSSQLPFNGQFAAGDVINSEQGSGVVTIWNIGFGKQQIKLDMSDGFHPARTSELGDVDAAEDSDSRHHVVWVNSDPNVPHGTGGDFYRPFQRVADAQQAVLSPGLINILPGSGVEPNLTLSGKTITLRSFRSGAIIAGH